MPRPGPTRSGRRLAGRDEHARAEAERFMALALGEALKGVGRTHPNPAVGAVVVKDGEVVGRGFHRRAGLAHGEAVALRRAGERAKGADLYVTLEPCAHQGRTGPCTDAVLDAGIRRVFIGTIDPNPKVSGRGVRRLRSRGVQVTTGVLGDETAALIQGFTKHIRTGRPFVVLKAAASLDGKIATAGGDSKWVTGEASRALVHRMRDELDGVLVGAGTVVADDPLLTVRLSKAVVPGRKPRTPVRIVLDGALRSPLDARIFDTTPGPVWVATARAAGAKARKLRARGVEVLDCAGTGDELELGALLDELGRRGLGSLLVEGGSEVHRAFLSAGLADELRLFVAPKVVGADGLSWAGPLGVSLMAKAPAFELRSVERVGDDVLLVARPKVKE